MSDDFLIVRLAVRKGFPLPGILVRHGRRYEIVNVTSRTVGRLIEKSPGDEELFPCADIELFDEYVLKVREISSKEFFT